MATQAFYLVNDDRATARAITLSEKDDLKSLQKTVADLFHIAGKQGMFDITDLRAVREWNTNFYR